MSSYHYNFPEQNIPESKKTREWMMECADAICSAFQRNSFRRTRDILCYEILEGIISSRRFEYITKEFGKTYPAKLKNYPLIRPILNTALGEEIEQNFNYNVRRIDEDGLDYKKRSIAYEVTKRILDDIYEKKVSNPIEVKYVGELEEKIANDFITEVEIIASKLASYYEHKLDLKTKKNKLFASTLETGKCFFKIEIPRLGADPQVRIIPPYAIEYSDEDVEDIADCTYVVERVFMTAEEILDLYGDELTEEEKKYIKDYRTPVHFDSQDFRISLLEDRDAIDKIRDEGYENFYRNYFADSYENKIEVYRGQWKSIRKLTMVELLNEKNKYASFYKLFEDTKIPKKDRVLSKDSRYIQELYEFVRIGNGVSSYAYNSRGNNTPAYRGIYVRLGKSPIQIRSIDNPYYVKSHYHGFIFSIDSSGVPFSLVWYLRDLQELYNILNYHRERMIALSGVKGIVYDLSQIPTGMQLEDVLYYRKLGLALIESEKNRTGFNQFQGYNDSLDASVSIITQMLEDIRIEADRVSGFNRQRQGQMFQKDLVGQIDRAIRQGAYATAVLYHHQDKVYRALLESLINFSKYAYKDNNSYKTLSYVVGDGRQDIFKISDDFVLSDFGIFFTSSGKENAKLEQVKGMLQAMIQQGQLKPADAISILKVDNIAELESKIITRLRKQEEEMAKLQEMQAQQPDKQMEMKMQELKTIYEIEKMKLKEAKEIKILELQVEKQKELQKAKNEKEKLEIDRKYKEEILSLKRELLGLEREEYRDAIQKENIKLKSTNRKETKNIV